MRWSLIFAVAACTDEIPSPPATPLLPSIPGTLTLGPEWDHCPGEEAAVGESDWQNALSATGNAVYCSTLMPGEPLDALLDTVPSRLRIMPGQWGIPLEEMEAVSLGLPLCIDQSGSPGPTPGVGGATAGALSDTTVEVAAQFPLGDDELEMRVRYETVLSGHFAVGTEPSFGEVDFWTTGTPALAYVACGRESNECDALGFLGAEIQVDQVTDVSPDAQEQRTRITRARGLYGGITFDIEDPSKLQVAYGSPLEPRHARIWFFGPIDEVCGLELVDYTRSAETREVWTMGCDGTRLEMLEVTDESHSRFAGCG